MEKHKFYSRLERHVRGKRSGYNKKGAKVHPALIVGEAGSDYYSMGMTSTEPKNKKQRKKLKQLSLVKTSAGDPVWIRREIDKGAKSSYSPEIYNGFAFTEEEQSFVDAQVKKKKAFLQSEGGSGASLKEGHASHGHAKHPQQRCLGRTRAKPNGSATRIYPRSKSHSSSKRRKPKRSK